ncbi:MAG TPA: glycosyltransferase, partial [Pirellulales bacterium]|nr:glycosyltransferase [Pirellulales bacterium]
CKPGARTVTHNYTEACRAWFAGQPIYQEGVHGFLYLPQAAILFAPFACLPQPWGDLLWRAVGIGTLSVASWRLAMLLGQRARPSLFSVVTLLAIPPALASARNGQMNLVLIALMTLAFVSLATRRWTAAAMWLCLGIALKPLMAVPIGVAVVSYPKLVRPLAIGLVLAALGPFLTQHPTYVAEQYLACMEKLLTASEPGTANPHADLFGLVSSLGWHTSEAVQTAARATALALVTLACVGARRRKNAGQTALFCLTLTAGYLTLFNPRAENNSYVLLAPSLGGLAATGLVRDGRRTVVWLLGLATLGITCTYELTRGPNFWVCPFFASLVVVYVVGEIFAKGRHRTARQAPEDAPRDSSVNATPTPLERAPNLAVAVTRADHDLTVVIPAHNEAARLPDSLAALARWLDTWGIDYRVLVVDDGSDDHTANVTGGFGPRFSTLPSESPRGKGAAVRRGMMSAKGQVVAFTDADLPYDLQALRMAYDWVRSGRCQVVFGARDLPGAVARASRRPMRIAASVAFRWLSRRLVSRRVTDTQCGLKVFAAGAARSIFSRTRLNGFAFDAEVVWLCERLRLPFRRMPVALINEYGSSLSVSRHALGMLYDVVRLRWLHRGDDEPAIA